MIRKMMLPMVLGVMFCAGVVYGQDAEAEAEALVFNPLVRVMDLPAGCEASVKALLPGASTPVTVVDYKAYPYGTTFSVGPKVTLRTVFEDTVFLTVRGPAVFTPKAEKGWKKVSVEVQKGDYNVATGKRVVADQFTITTPLGSFESVQGLVRLHVGDIAKGTVAKEDFSFRLIEGTAIFKGLHYAMSSLSKADAFHSADVEGMTQSQIFGDVGEVDMDLPMSGDGKNLPFALTPGATVKITREKAPGSDNWTVAVLTLYANGKAQNYFCYVENRGEGYYTGDLIAEIFPEEEEGEEDDEDDEDGYDSDDVEDIPDEMSDFGDLDLE